MSSSPRSPASTSSGFGFGDTQAIKFAGASTDGSHVYFTVPGNHLLDSNPAPPLGANTNLYEYSGGQLKLVGVLPGGGVAPGRGLARRRAAPAARAVSTDGERVYWQSNGRLYLRDGGQSTLVSERESDASAQSADFEFASAVRLLRLPHLQRETDPRREPLGHRPLPLRRRRRGARGPHPDRLLRRRLAGAWRGRERDLRLLHRRRDLAPGAIVGEDNLYAWHEGEGVRLIGRLDARAGWHRRGAGERRRALPRPSLRRGDRRTPPATRAGRRTPRPDAPSPRPTSTTTRRTPWPAPPARPPTGRCTARPASTGPSWAPGSSTSSPPTRA